ncbi:hypothetical protein HYPSUDRAFT_741768 [Hypholoma sublateritium FD-334 SS-4]|uniref:F-box domain-containing protein n=1 Tax=Hypholoma sublateritium (strain FD-334 SS-4) TaxID=945553 RepID=A0A0D2NRC8_HYPSF|nr:hypothetical protein HYPSUDRAFT_741768 [Hypholoma sublateritium FD-334 SS-4]
MHRLFGIHEIIEKISEAVLVQPHGLDRRSLVSVLKTCRSFSVVATRLLWRDLHNLVPLILTMPDDLLGVESWDLDNPSSKFMPRSITFRRDVVPSDWERFDLYAPLVRHLSVIERLEQSPASFLVLDPLIYHALERRNHVLLPNLSTMVASRSDLPAMTFLLTSPIHRLKVHMHPSQIPQLYDLLQFDIPLNMTRLTSLHLAQSGMPWSQEHRSIIGPALATLLRELDLEEFECDWFNLEDEHVELLLKMPALRVASIFKSVAALDRVLLLHPIGKTPRLRSFTIWADTIVPRHLAGILVSLRPGQLEAFSVHPTGPNPSCTTAELAELTRAIAESCAPAHFAQLCLEIWQGVGPVRHAPADFGVLHPLAAFAHLRQLVLPSHALDLTDVEVETLARAWPRLEVLAVNTSAAAPRATLRSLLALATHCRALRSVTFQFAGGATFDDAELASAAGHGLHELSVGCSTAPDAGAVAAFLRVVFPKLALLLWMPGPLGNANNALWEQVEAEIQ